MKTIIAALLLSQTSAVSLNIRFASGVDEGVDLTGTDIDGDRFDFSRVVGLSAAQEGSGVRARWVELPMCDTHLSAGDIPLYDDLSNASIATCKGYRPHLNSTRPDPYAPHIVLPPNLPTPIESNYTTNATNTTYVYDPILKTREPLLDHHHQVATHQEGHVDPTPFAGPIQTLAQERWVELPNCTGAPGEIWLKDNLANASAATCKIDPYNRPN